MLELNEKILCTIWVKTLIVTTLVQLYLKLVRGILRYSVVP